MTVEDVFVNTGCKALNFTSVTADESDLWGQTIPDLADKINPEFLNRASTIADKLVRNAYLSKYLQARDNLILAGNPVTVRETALTKFNLNRAATGLPSYLNAVTWPYPGAVLPAGDTADLVLDVIQSSLGRGPNDFYLYLETDDPDFFLNDTSRGVCLRVTLNGGCVIDTTTLHFGAGGSNRQLVTNTGRLGTGDWTPHAFEIDGVDDAYYQGAYVYAVSTHRVATNSRDWRAGGGENDVFVSFQGDPNWCDNNCKPYLNANIQLGTITRDGGNSYVPLYGNMVCRSFLDSVQNFDPGDGWDWNNWGASFDNDSTIGLYVNSRTIGAIDVPELTNVTVDILEFSERNGDSIKGWYLGSFHDFDLGGDTVDIDRDISTCWNYNRPAGDAAWGAVKIPFGCGFEPAINIHGMYGATEPSNGLWDWYGYWDSCYTWLTEETAHVSQDMSNGDGEVHFTLARHDFAPYETLTVAVAHFGIYGLSDASSPVELEPLATMINKWLGFGRGDVNNDGTLNLADIVYLAATVNGGPGAVPFAHLGDVNIDGNIDVADVDYLIAYYFHAGPVPRGDWVL